jgi:WD40-like Beta Propeller Repeat
MCVRACRIFLSFALVVMRSPSAAVSSTTQETHMIRMSKHSAIALAVAAATTAPTAQAHEPGFGPWENTQPVLINTSAFAEGCPIESPDGRNLYIASNRTAPGAQGKLDIYRARRASVGSSWGIPENLGATVNSPEFDYCPTPLGGKWLMFVTSKDTENDGDPGNDDCLAGPPAPPPPGGPSAGDMYLTLETRLGWFPPLHLGCLPHGPNTPGAEFSPALIHTKEDTFLYFSSDGYPDSKLQDIYASRVLRDGTVLPGTRVAALSTDFDDRMPNVRADGLEIVFSSNRPGGAGQQDVYVATRKSTRHPWSPPRRIEDPAINTPASETRSSLSGDGKRLYFGRKVDVNDPGDIYVSTRRNLLRRGD